MVKIEQWPNKLGTDVQSGRLEIEIWESRSTVKGARAFFDNEAVRYKEFAPKASPKDILQDFRSNKRTWHPIQ